MAFGSFVGFRRYINKTFGLEESLGALKDGRANPVVPFLPAMLTWLWGIMRQLESTEQVGNLFNDARWRKLLRLRPEDGGSPDTLARVLDELTIGELNDFQLKAFFEARRAGLLKDDGPFAKRCAIVDLNELFSSEKIHCDKCQSREKEVAGADGELRKVTEYFHQAVALVWAGEEVAWPINWELLEPGEGELTAAFRLLRRLLPQLSKSLDLVMGDALYCCRPFFEIVRGAGIDAFAIASGQTELDQEMDLLRKTEPPRQMLGQDVDLWELESEAWKNELKRPLRVLHYERRYPAPEWKHERKHLRAVTSADVNVLPAGQGWSVGRCRWKIENGTFNLLTRDYSLTHNYRHSPTAIVALLVLRSICYCLTWAYRRFATARSKSAPKTMNEWITAVLWEDWVRYLDGALPANPMTG
jgi:hypothetical protein